MEQSISEMFTNRIQSTKILYLDQRQMCCYQQTTVLFMNNNVSQSFTNLKMFNTHTSKKQYLILFYAKHECEMSSSLVPIM